MEYKFRTLETLPWSEWTAASGIMFAVPYLSLQEPGPPGRSHDHHLSHLGSRLPPWSSLLEAGDHNIKKNIVLENIYSFFTPSSWVQTALSGKYHLL